MGNGGSMALYVAFNARDLVRGCCVSGAVLPGNAKDNLPAQPLAFFEGELREYNLRHNWRVNGLVRDVLTRAVSATARPQARRCASASFDPDGAC